MASDEKRLPWPALLRRAAGIPILGLALVAVAPEPAARPALPAAAAGPHGGFDLAQQATFSERRNVRGGRDWRVVEARFRVAHVVLPPRLRPRPRHPPRGLPPRPPRRLASRRAAAAAPARAGGGRGSRRR
jgi:hypothetical protein